MVGCRSVVALALIAGSGSIGCGAAPNEQGTEGSPDAIQPSDVGQTTQALDATCDPRYGTLHVTSGSNPTVTYWGDCFAGGHQVIVWITDWNTGRQIGSEEYYTTAPDPYKGFFSSSISGCPSTGYVFLHAIDFWGQKRADWGPFTIHC